MPVQGKRRYVDEETGQLVEGMCLHVVSLHAPTCLFIVNRLRLHLRRR